MGKVFVFGSVNMDMVFNLKRLPKPGETIKSDDFFMNPGGKGANQAVSCALFGASTYMLGTVGNDDLALTAKKSLEDYGVNLNYLDSTNRNHTGVAGIFLEDGENRIVTYSGANSYHNQERISQILENVGLESDYLLSQLEVPLEHIEESFKAAKKKGIITVLNAAPVQELPNSILSLVDILVVNETEAEALTGIYPHNLDDVHLTCDKLLRKGVGAVLMTLGSKGSYYLSKKEKIITEAFKVDVKDTTAAGDTFIGSFIASLVSGNRLKESLVIASAAAAIAIQRLGALSSIPNKDEIYDFLMKRGIINEEANNS